MVNITMSDRKKHVVQWYIDKYGDEDTPCSNFLPWNRYKKPIRKSQQIVDEIQHKHPDFCKHTFVKERRWHTWKEFPEETTIKYLKDQEQYIEKNNVNIFVIRFHNTEQEIFVNPRLSPLDSLPSEAINFLRKHPGCFIVFHDVHEAKSISAPNWWQIPSIGMSRWRLNLNNPVMWINSQSNAHVHYQGMQNMPPWLTIGGAAHWLQFLPFIKGDRESLAHTEDIDACLEEPNFETGRFLFYGGRWRLGRMYLLSKLLDSVDSQHLYASASGLNSFGADVERGIMGHMFALHRTSKYPKDVPDFTNTYTREFVIPNDNDIKNLRLLYDKMPFSTFPAELEEENTYYNKKQFRFAPNPNHYKHIFIDIVTESYSERSGVYHNTLFLTEKIAKPLRACRPFIVSANAGYYKELHKLGFKTFDRWWDESFDHDLPLEEHTDKITAIVKEISSWSTEKCKQVYEEMKPTLIHNRKVLDDLRHKGPRLWLESVKDCEREWRDRPNPKR